jgi:hypothetical protein
MPSDNFDGEDLDVIKRVCKYADLTHTEKKPTREIKVCGIGYLGKGKTGHCVNDIDAVSSTKGTLIIRTMHPSPSLASEYQPMAL